MMEEETREKVKMKAVKVKEMIQWCCCRHRCVYMFLEGRGRRGRSALDRRLETEK